MTVTIVLIRLLVLSVIFVNGWTDAPNTIATAVGSGAMGFRRAAALAAGCNFLGAVLACLLYPAVAATVGSLVSFSQPQAALTALCAALLTIVIWAVAAWRFGLPTSESHALLAGLSGAALALGGGAALSAPAWTRALAGMFLSLPAGAAAARAFRGWLAGHPCNAAAWQRRAAAVMALLHGAQDGQKFLALMLMADDLGGWEPSPVLPLIVLTACAMAAGTALGGKPIVDKVGSQLAALTPAEGLAADGGAGLVMAVCAGLGLPVSTTHAKVAAVCGAGRHLNRSVAAQIAGAWLLTFPCCAGLAFVLTRLMLAG